MSFRKWRSVEPSSVPVEAEDMFPPAFLQRFVHSRPRSIVAEEIQFKDGTFHYGFSQEGKKDFQAYVTEQLKPQHCTLWVSILEHVRKQLKLSS